MLRHLSRFLADRSAPIVKGGAAFLALLATTTVSRADLIDLTTANSSASITAAFGGAGTFFVQQADPASTGTGVINSFVRLNPGGSSPNERGYNTDGRPLQFDENNSPSFTRSVLLSAVPTLTINGVLYRQFLLDINQTNADPLLSLNQIQIFQTSNASLLGATETAATATTTAQITFGASATEIFRMNDSSDPNFHQIILNYALNSGSGSGDMFLDIPDAWFTGAGAYVVLFSQFGTGPGLHDQNDGFEEWSYGDTAFPQNIPAVPAPAGVILMGMGGLLVGLQTWRNKRKARVAV